MQVLSAVQSLYHDFDVARQAAANQWLMKFQRERAAWQVANDILSSENVFGAQLELQHFAAQTLRRKVYDHLDELAPEERNALMHALLMHARKFSYGPPQLLKQICLALAGLALQCSEWGNPVEHLLNSSGITVSADNPEGIDGGPPALELLTVLPEEGLDDKAGKPVTSKRKKEFHEQLLSQRERVLELLVLRARKMDANAQAATTERRNILRCLLSWVRIDVFSGFAATVLASHPLVTFAFESLQGHQTQVFEEAVEVLVELITRIEGLPRLLISKVLPLKDALLVPALLTHNEVVVNGLCRLMAELGQAVPAVIAEATTETLALSDAMLRCVILWKSNWEIVQSGLPFWSAIAVHILSLPSTSEHRQRAMAAFKPMYTSLLDGLVVRLQIDDPEDCKAGNGKVSLPDGLVDFRYNVEEALTNICRLLGPIPFLSQLLRGVEHWSAPGATTWQSVEAKLYVIQLVVEEVLLDGQHPAELVPLMQFIVSLPSNPLPVPDYAVPLVHKSAAEVVGAYAEWLCSYPSAALPLLSFLALGLSSSISTSACATALRKVCEEVKVVVQGPTAVEGLLHIGERLHTLPLSLAEERDVLCAIGKVLSAAPRGPCLLQAAQRLFQSVQNALEELLDLPMEKSPSRQQSGSSSQVAYAMAQEAAVRALNRLAAICSDVLAPPNGCLKDDDPMLSVLTVAWPLLERLLTSAHAADSGIAAGICRCLIEAMNATGQKFAPLLQPFLTAMASAFTSLRAHACFIKAAAAAIQEFGSDPKFASTAIEILRTFSQAEVAKSLSTRQGCDAEPEIAEQYMRLMTTFIVQCPRDVLVAVEGLLEVAITRAAACASSSHRLAAPQAFSFLSAIYEVAAKPLSKDGAAVQPATASDALLNVCIRTGPAVMSGIVHALLGLHPVGKLPKISKVFELQCALCFRKTGGDFGGGLAILQTWIASALHALPPGVLVPGEAEMVLLRWMESLAADQRRLVLGPLPLNTERPAIGGRTVGMGQMDSSLRCVLREFIENHRYTTLQ
ncbi:hypothetical protein CBR_g30317 [Chara braunii]|uniref:Exportin-1/Importin-beta-like domain-containing protein n=1 Tax=Chara braunii TaxID=69332 RepID=A0A388JXC0_CHABU|nr:hypothetical protein CBR_g30317 [Chara braunii]|eukprot:GBG62363.1 hypothetical protein CBR_g30317 [Chara braunii]